MNLIELNSFGENFVNRVKKSLPEGFTVQDITVLATGLVLVPNSKQENQGFRPLGCPECLDKNCEQDSEGYPAIEGKRLLTPDTFNIPMENVSPELIANLWLCPECRMPINTLLPRFDTSAM